MSVRVRARACATTAAKGPAARPEGTRPRPLGRHSAAAEAVPASSWPSSEWPAERRPDPVSSQGWHEGSGAQGPSKGSPGGVAGCRTSTHRRLPPEAPRALRGLMAAGQFPLGDRQPPGPRSCSDRRERSAHRRALNKTDDETIRPRAGDFTLAVRDRTPGPSHGHCMRPIDDPSGSTQVGRLPRPSRPRAHLRSRKVVACAGDTMPALGQTGGIEPPPRRRESGRRGGAPASSRPRLPDRPDLRPEPTVQWRLRSRP
jgi:hypothetical protein